MDRRVLVIGLDGATLDLIEPWSSAGYLPNLSRLMTQGAHGRLQSTVQPVTAPAWATFMTGVNQGQHGLFDFVRRRPGSYDLEITNGSMISTPTIFEIVGNASKRVAALGVPMTFPPRQVNGMMVSDTFAPVADQRIVYPQSLFGALYEAVPGYFDMASYGHTANAISLQDYINRLVRMIDYREQLAVHVLQMDRFDLFMVVFMETDWIQHSFWGHMESPDSPYRDAILNIYRRVDQAIGYLLEFADNQTSVIIMSDHGAGRWRYLINLNRQLAHAGFLRYHEGKGQSVRARLVNRLGLAYRRYVPVQIRFRIRSRLGVSQFTRLQEKMESTLFTTAIDWEHTKAYALGSCGNIWLNVAGREPMGTVQSGTEYERICDEVVAALMELVDPETGDPIIRQIHRRDVLYHGPNIEYAPDLIIEWVHYGYWGRGRYDIRGASVFEKPERFELSDIPLSGSHRLPGTVILYGPSVPQGAILQDACIVDIAPTILHALRLAVPDYMDGRSLVDSQGVQLVASATTDRANDTVDEVSYSHEEAELIANRLRDLGYL